MKTFTLTFQISDEAYNLLSEIEKARTVEYRDTEYQTIKQFKKSLEFLNSFIESKKHQNKDKKN